ncbi:hypothetical protein CXG81DRAFT_25780 [Caulochytrium protostelioides]|uniref:Cilia- and flagella-associated protein 61 N-terminal domain-containing protein n=1 Tax=Caulochytrium protostelioides TaxID=1555241 RepID=A0A4V1IUS4_9FUNG|nr:hypothetical protein CXG81DRAFT_25780 [Caulochytrium protostelioides]|eukprot:RKP01569.1 hypothetical protein CXG81DRAFT_25780 [Caulochytrium protostelioides]
MATRPVAAAPITVHLAENSDAWDVLALLKSTAGPAATTTTTTTTFATTNAVAAGATTAPTSSSSSSDPGPSPAKSPSLLDLDGQQDSLSRRRYGPMSAALAVSSAIIVGRESATGAVIGVLAVGIAPTAFQAALTVLPEPAADGAASTAATDGSAVAQPASARSSTVSPPSLHSPQTAEASAAAPQPRRSAAGAGATTLASTLQQRIGAAPEALLPWESVLSSLCGMPVRHAATRLLTFYHARPDVTNTFLAAALELVWAHHPETTQVLYVVPDRIVPFAPFTTATRVDRLGVAHPLVRTLRLVQPDAMVQVQAAARPDAVSVRPCRIEDCEDVEAVLARMHLGVDDLDAYFTRLMSTPGYTNLVAHANGKMVGFMALVEHFDAQRLVDTYAIEQVVASPFTDPASSEAGDDVDELAAAGSRGHRDTLAARLNDTAGVISLFHLDPAYKRHDAAFFEFIFTHLPEIETLLLTCPMTAVQPTCANRMTWVPARPLAAPRHVLYCHVRCATEQPLSVTPVEHALVAPNDPARPLHAKPQYEFTVWAGGRRAVGAVHCFVHAAPLPRAFHDQFDLAEAHIAASDRVAFLCGVTLAPAFRPRLPAILELVMAQLGGIPLLDRIVPDRVSRLGGSGGDGSGGASGTVVSPPVPAARTWYRRYLTPVAPRREIQFPDNQCDGVTIAPKLPFALAAVAPHTVWHTHWLVHPRVVVLGGSDVALAFLLELQRSPMLRLTHLTLITQAPIPSIGQAAGPVVTAGTAAAAEEKPVVGRDLSFFQKLEPTSLDAEFTPSLLCQSGLSSQVHPIMGHLVEILRASQEIRVQLAVPGPSGASTVTVPYDYLVLAEDLETDMTAWQTATTEAAAAAASTLTPTTTTTAVTPASMAKYLFPWSPSESRMHAFYSQVLLSPATTPVVIHGSNPRAWLVLTRLLGMGVPASRLRVLNLLASPKTLRDRMPELDVAFTALLNENGIFEYREVTHLTLLPPAADDIFPRVQFAYHDAEADAARETTFSTAALLETDRLTLETMPLADAVRDACLVVDHRIVINEHGATADARIFAAGPTTRFANKFKTRVAHADFSPREVGTRLAHHVLALLTSQRNAVPLLPEDDDEADDDADADGKHRIPPFHEAVATYVALPGGWSLYHDHAPPRAERVQRAAATRLGARAAAVDESVHLTTHDTAHGGTLASLRIDAAGHISALTVLTRGMPPLQNLRTLHRRSIRLFPYLAEQVAIGAENAGIDDLLAYLSRPNNLAVYHDRFPLLMKALEQQILEAVTRDTPSGGTLVQTEADLVRFVDTYAARGQWDRQILHYLTDTGLFVSFP